MLEARCWKLDAGFGGVRRLNLGAKNVLKERIIK